MRLNLIITPLLFISVSLMGQKTEIKNPSSTYGKNGYKIIKVKGIIGAKKILAVQVGQKAIMYFNYDTILNGIKKDITPAGKDDAYQKTFNYLSSLPIKNDTAYINYDSTFVRPDSALVLKLYMTLDLRSGDVKIYYKKQKVFVKKILSRLVIFGNVTDGFYYFPDQRAFFGIPWSGKRDNKYVNETEEKLFKSTLER